MSMKIFCYRYHLSLERSLFVSAAKETFNKDPEEIEKSKNIIFANFLHDVVKDYQINNQDPDFSVSLVYEDIANQRFLLRCGKPKKIELLKKDMVDKTPAVSWDNYVNIFVDNKTNYQLIGIEQNKKLSFNLIKKKFFDVLAKKLSDELLDFHLSSISSSYKFWEFVTTYSGCICKLKVDVFAQNMACANRTADKFLKEMRAGLDATKVEMIFSADKGALNISKDNEDVQSIEELSHSGMSDITMTAIDHETRKPKAEYDSRTENVSEIVTINKKKVDTIVECLEKNDDNAHKIFSELFENIERTGREIK